MADDPFDYDSIIRSTKVICRATIKFRGRAAPLPIRDEDELIMTKTLDEIATDLRQLVVYMDGLGDIGTARADQLLAIAHALQDTVAMVRIHHATAEVCLNNVTEITGGLVDRVGRLERVYLPSSQESN